jgi:hypothetical protein
LIGDDGTHLLAPDIDRHPDHAVAVVSGKIGGREVRRDAPGFFRRGVRMGENFRNEVDQILNLHSDHDQSLPQALALA